MTAVVGIPACTKLINGHTQHATPARYAAALLGGADAVSVLIPPLGEVELAVLDRLDGLLLNGSPSNVDPRLYGAGEDLTPQSHDAARDATTLPMLRAAIARGMPVLAICRGIQELNVAFGGSLFQQVHLQPGRRDHDAREDLIEDQYLPRHTVRLEGGLARIMGETSVSVNSLHEQAIDRLADGLVAEAWAEDGTIEGVRVSGAAGFAYGVQWHPEWRYADYPDRRALFSAFGAACRDFSRTGHPQAAAR
jgi:putative glutamine amidotransferase